MHIFVKSPKHTGRNSVPQESPPRDDWPDRRHSEGDESRGETVKVSARPSPRGILRNSFGVPAEETEHFKAGNASRRRPPSSQASSPARQSHHSINTSSSVSQPSAHPHIHALSRTSDAEADRLARACGDGPFSPTSPTPYLSTSAFTSTSSQSLASSRVRSQSISVAHLQRRRSSTRPVVRDFPYLSPQQAVRALKRILTEETKTFKIHDYIEVEDLISGKLWEDEEELLVDCVRDRVDDDSGHDGVWRRERRERMLVEAVQRKIRQRDQNVFGSYIQDLPESALVPVVVGGYRHHVPAVLHACIEELYRTGIYEHGLFRTLPNRSRLFQLVAYFDKPKPQLQASQVTSRSSLPNITNPPAISTPPLRSSLTPSPTASAGLHSLHQESYPELCALLVTYLTSLPSPLIHRSLSAALWSWCVSPSLLRQSQRQRRSGDADASSSSSDSDDEDEEEHGRYANRVKRREEVLLNLPALRVQVKLARQVLLLLPKRTFGVLVCLMRFLETVAGAPGVGLGAEDVGRIFGGAIAGGRARRGSVVEADEDARADKEEKGEKIVVWLVRHWSQVAVTYERDEGPRGGGGRRVSSGVPGDVVRQSIVSRARSKSVDVDWRDEAAAEEKVIDRWEEKRYPRASADYRQEKLRRSSSPERRSSTAIQYDYAVPQSRLQDDVYTPGVRRVSDEDDDRTVVRCDSPAPKLELPIDLSREDKLFATPAPFDVDVHDELLDDDDSVYSSDETSLYDTYTSNLMHEPLPPLSGDTPAYSKIPRHAKAAAPTRPDLSSDASAASRFVLERENVELKRRLEEAVGARDEARRVVDAMRGLVQSGRASG